jgi:hypothetical protein
MAIFRKSSPEDALEALRSRASKLESRRVVAQASLDEAKAKRQQHLVEGDVDGDEKLIARLEADVNAASSRLSGLIDALSALNVQISEAERQLQVERDHAERKAAAERMSAAINDFEARLDPMLSAMRLFASACEPLMAVSFEIVQLKEYLLKVAGEVEVCAAFVSPDLRLQAGMIERGERQIPRESAQVIELLPSMPTPTSPGDETQVVFTLKPVKWRARDGEMQSVQRWEDCSMPTRLLARATRHEAITLDMADRRRRENKGILNGFTSTPPNAFIDLDAELLPPPADALPPGFEPLHTVGPEYQLQHREPQR